jgi:hypothetical protein
MLGVRDFWLTLHLYQSMQLQTKAIPVLSVKLCYSDVPTALVPDIIDVGVDGANVTC